MVDVKLHDVSLAEDDAPCYSINAAAVHYHTETFPVMPALPATFQ